MPGRACGVGSHHGRVMKELLVDGARLLTTDAVADAALEHARQLAQQGRADVIDFPAVVEGRETRAWVTIGAGTALVVLGTPDDDLALVGSDFAAQLIWRKARVLSRDFDDFPDEG